MQGRSSLTWYQDGVSAVCAPCLFSLRAIHALSQSMCNTKGQLLSVMAMVDDFAICIFHRGWPRPSDNVVTQKREELVEQLSAAGIRVDRDADTRLYQYYPPFAPTFIRLQDVLLPVEYEGSSDKKDE